MLYEVITHQREDVAQPVDVHHRRELFPDPRCQCPTVLPDTVQHGGDPASCRIEQRTGAGPDTQPVTCDQTQRNEQCRITSYNVCYTKLLRGIFEITPVSYRWTVCRDVPTNFANSSRLIFSAFLRFLILSPMPFMRFNPPHFGDIIS